jgi:acyl-CoA synthetase (AMP-forming)/AMP-acid ligase II
LIASVFLKKIQNSAKVVSPKDKATILPINEKGELAISGYNVQKYYWNDPEKTSAAMPVDSDNRIWMLVIYP